MSPRRHSLVVVGAGPAGIAAATEAARQGFRPLLIDASGRAGGTIAVAHEVRNVPFLPDRVAGVTVADQLAAFLQRWDVTVTRGRVLGIRDANDGLALDVDGRDEVVADRVVLATGTQALHPHVAGLPDDFSFPWADSAPAAWKGRALKTVAVIGAGDVAFDQARWCAARGASVTVLCRSERPRAPRWLVDAARDEGVAILTSVRATRGRIEEGQAILELERAGADAVEAAFDSIVAAIGRAPNRIAGQLSVKASRFAIAGDVRGWRARHVVAALGDGCVAATAILGDGARSMQ